MASRCSSTITRGSASDTSNLFSVTKSVVGTLIGIALSDGSLGSIDQPLGELLPAYAADMEPEEAAITLRQLLTMTAGLPEELGRDLPEWMLTDDWVRSILAEPLEQSPGEGFAYSNASSHLLSAVLTEATGMSVLDYARARLFDPLGITSRPAPDLQIETTASRTVDCHSTWTCPCVSRWWFAWPGCAIRPDWGRSASRRPRRLRCRSLRRR